MMYMIALQLSAPIAEYSALTTAIQGFGDWSSRIPNVWIVQTARSARQMRDALKPHLKPTDRAFIAHFDRNWSATNMGEGFGDWMARRTYDPPGANPVTPVIATPLNLVTTPANTAPKGKSRPGVRPPPKR